MNDTGTSLTTDKTATATNANYQVVFNLTWTDGEKDSSPVYTAGKTYLTDADGNTKVWLNGALVPGTPGANTNPYGVCRVKVASIQKFVIAGVDKAIGDLTTQQKAAFAGTYTFSVVNNQDRVRFGPSARGEGHYLDDNAAVSFSVVLSSAAAITTNEYSSIYYSINGVNGTDVVGNAEDTAFEVSFSASVGTFTPAA